MTDVRQPMFMIDERCLKTNAHQWWPMIDDHWPMNDVHDYW